MKNVALAVWHALLSPQARRYETGLAILVYEAVRSGLGHP